MTQDTPAALNPESFLPLGAIVNGTTCIERLERDYAFRCEAGPLVNCADWDMLKRCFFHLAEHAQEIAQREPDDATGWKGPQAATSAAGGATGETETLLDAADEWANYVIEDRAPMTLRKYLERALAQQGAQNG